MKIELTTNKILSLEKLKNKVWKKFGQGKEVLKSSQIIINVSQTVIFCV